MILPKRGVSLVIIIFLFVCFVAILNSRLNPLVSLTMALMREPEVVVPFTTHIVLFQFKQGTSPVAIKEVRSKECKVLA